MGRHTYMQTAHQTASSGVESQVVVLDRLMLPSVYGIRRVSVDGIRNSLSYETPFAVNANIVRCNKTILFKIMLKDNTL